MSKHNKPTTKPEVVKLIATPALEEAPKVAKIRVIKVLKTDAKFRGAREAWYNELKAHDGKTVKEFEDKCEKTPPSKPKKGKFAATGEPPSGWTSYFIRNGIAQIVEQEVKA